MKIGFFGKLPGYGDFIQRNVSQSFIKYLDNWIMQSIETSRGQLQDQWQSRYFNSPIWRFAIGANIMSEHAITGFIMPSVDKAGRCYPFVVICHCEQLVNTSTLARKMDPLHHEAEEFVLGLLERNSPDLDDIANVLNKLYQDIRESQFNNETAIAVNSSMELAAFSEDDEHDFSCANESFLDNLLAEKNIKLTLWWMAGGVGLSPTKRYYSGMPPVDNFHSFLIGADD